MFSDKIGIQFASDLHLEFYDKDYPKLKYSAPYLVLAGDIGYPFHPSYKEYLQSLSNYKKIYIISGNHEYYQTKGEYKTMEEIDLKIQEICSSLPNVVFLNNSSEIIEGNIRIIGSTLWSEVPITSQSYMEECMNDYYKIYTKPTQLITSQETTIIHHKNVDWLTNEIEKYKDNNIIVVTHHLPSNEFIDTKYQNHPLNYGFVTSLDKLIKKPISIWIAGHTHHCKSLVINDVQCEVNSKGYPGEGVVGFRDDAVVYI